MFYFLSLELCLWGTFHIDGIIQYVVSLSDFFHGTCFQGSSLLLHEYVVYFFLLLNSIPLCGCTTFCQPVYQLMDIPFFFFFFAIMNNAAMNIYVQVFVSIYIYFYFCFFGRYLRIELWVTWYISVFLFVFVIYFWLHRCLQAFSSCSTRASHSGGF